MIANYWSYRIDNNNNNNNNPSNRSPFPLLLDNVAPGDEVVIVIRMAKGNALLCREIARRYADFTIYHCL